MVTAEPSLLRGPYRLRSRLSADLTIDLSRSGRTCTRPKPATSRRWPCWSTPARLPRAGSCRPSGCCRFTRLRVRAGRRGRKQQPQDFRDETLKVRVREIVPNVRFLCS